MKRVIETRCGRYAGICGGRLVGNGDWRLIFIKNGLKMSSKNGFAISIRV